MDGIKVAAAAEQLGISKVSVHKWVKRLTLIERGLAQRDNGVVLLTEEGLKVIGDAHREKNPVAGKPASKEDVNPTAQVAENPREVYEKVYEHVTDRFDQEVRFLRQELTRRDETIQQMLTKQSEERQRTDSIIMKLAHDLEDTRRSALAIEMKVDALLPKPADPLPEAFMEPPKPVQVWSPPKGKSPTEGMGFLERVWVEFTQPELLRRNAEN